MPKLTPQQAQAKHAKNLKASIADIQAGIDRVTVSPGQQAAAKIDKWRAKLADPDVQAKWERQMRGLDVNAWKDVTKKKVASRLAQGIDEAASKVVQFYGELFPFEEALQARIHAMPDTTISDSVERARVWIECMAQFKRR